MTRAKSQKGQQPASDEHLTDHEWRLKMAAEGKAFYLPGRSVIDLRPKETVAFSEAVKAAHGVLDELDHGLRFLHRMVSEETDHLGLEATVALWCRAVRSVLDDKADTLEAVIKFLDEHSAKKEDA